MFLLVRSRLARCPARVYKRRLGAALAWHRGRRVALCSTLAPCSLRRGSLVVTRGYSCPLRPSKVALRAAFLLGGSRPFISGALRLGGLSPPYLLFFDGWGLCRKWAFFARNIHFFGFAKKAHFASLGGGANARPPRRPPSRAGLAPLYSCSNAARA